MFSSFFERTSLRSSAKEAATVYTGYFFWVHGLTSLFVWSKIAGRNEWPHVSIAKPYVLATFFAVVGVSYWIYCWRDRDEVVRMHIRTRYAPGIGLLLFVEAIAEPLVVTLGLKWLLPS